MDNPDRKDEDSDRLDLGNPLGVAHAPITRTPSDHLESGNDATARRRLDRALGEDGVESGTPGLGDTDANRDGAAGIDMGYGGDGTDVKSSR